MPNVVTELKSRTVKPSAFVQSAMIKTMVKLPQDLFFKVPVSQAVGPAFDQPFNANVPVHTSIDGKKYFVPVVRVARRSKTSPVPDVLFDKRPDGHTYLVLGIEFLRGTAPVDAEAFSIDQLAVSISGAEAVSLGFQIVDRPAVGEAVRAFQCAAQVPEAQLGVLVGLMQTKTDLWFRVAGRILTQQRIVELPPQAPEPRPRPVPRPPPGRPTRTPAMDRLVKPGIERIDMDIRPVADELILRPPMPRPSPIIRFEQREVMHVFSTPQTTPAVFPPGIAANRPIYFEVATGFDGAFGVAWRSDGDFGDVRESPRGGQYYILPDSYGLAFDRSSGLPAVDALLIATSSAGGQGANEYKVRVRFGLVPVIDQLRIERLRQFMREREGLPFAEVAIGGYDGAIFDCFPVLQMLGVEQASVPPADRARPVDAKNGFDLTMDLTIEQYTLLVQILKSGDRQAGAVRLTLTGENGVTLMRDVPVRLSLARPAELPLEVTIKEDEPDGPPHEITIRNTADCEVRIASVVPTLVATIDQRPVAAYAANASPTGVTLPPNGSEVVTVNPKDTDPKPVWNSLAIALAGVTASFNPEVVLARIHQLSGTTTLSSRVVVSSWMLADESRIPAPARGILYGIDVQLRRSEHEEPATLTLLLEESKKAYDLAFGLRDILAGQTPDFPTFDYRQRNRQTTGDGAWTPWLRFRGNSLVVNPELAS